MRGRALVASAAAAVALSCAGLLAAAQTAPAHHKPCHKGASCGTPTEPPPPTTAPPPAPTPGDTSPPTQPGNVVLSRSGATELWIGWDAAGDDVGVAGYRLYLDGAFTHAVPADRRVDGWVGLSCGSTHRLGVQAYDAADNRSAIAEVSAATAACSAPPPPPPNSPPATGCPVARPQTTWAPVGRAPLTDAQALACVTRTAENRSRNVPYQSYFPSDAELSAFRDARDVHYGERFADSNPYFNSVRGRPGAVLSTDDLLEWTAYKWGIPEDIVRGQAEQESGWHHLDEPGGKGDRADGVNASLWPAVARINAESVYESLGILQVRWRPNSRMNWGAEPLRWKSMPFHVDFYGAMTRYYYDGLCNWCGGYYAAGQAWETIGAWFNPTPWGSSGAYADGVYQKAAARGWLWWPAE